MTDGEQRHGDRDVAAVGARLRKERPSPPDAFRDGLERRLDDEAGGGWARWTPRQRAAIAAGALAGGCALLALAALGVAGGGPLAP